jgi:hypothetical protein
MKEKYLVFDNIISKTYLKQLVDNIFDYNWKFASNLTYGNVEQSVNAQDFEHGFNASLTKEQRYFILPLILKICDLSNIEISNKNQISRITPRLQTMISSNNEINDIHTDKEQNHYVIIFYPHNIDGDTILYNQTTLDLSDSKFNKMNVGEKKEATKNFTILKKITPKENQVVVFDGNRYHASSSPTKGPRCIINIHIDYDETKNKKNLNYS